MVRRLAVAIVACGLALGACRGARRAEPAGAVAALVDPDLQLLVTPSPEDRGGHQPFIRAIDAAHASIDMTMYHLTDLDVVAALSRAKARGVHVRVIVDRKTLEGSANHQAFETLAHDGVEVYLSSPAFSITHAKAMVVDADTAFITAINLTRDASRTRDLGIVTRDRGVVADVGALFEADWSNAANAGHATPPQHEASLVVSPVSSRARLVGLIASAQHELIVTVENLGDPQIEAALVAAVQRSASVRVIVPLCDKNPDPLLNLPIARRLAAAGVAVRMMPAPETAEQPYMHSKMILADRGTAYVGSVNFSVNSTTKARELGILFAQPAAAAQIRAIFETDWAHAVAPPTETVARCTDIHGDDPQ